LYSTPLNKPIDSVDAAILFDALARFIYGEKSQYYTHGEDWGSIVSTQLAQLYPNRVKGIHLSLCGFPDLVDGVSVLYGIIGPSFPSYFYTPEEIDAGLTSRFTIGQRLMAILKDMGYFHLQATWPDSIGHGLTDSPVGLLAYVLEKYSSWSFNFETEIRGKADGGLNKFDKDELLTIITLYWTTNSITSSIRLYKNSVNYLIDRSPWPKNKMAHSVVSKNVALGYQYFSNDIFFFPKSVVEFKYPNLKSYSIVKGGGHFAAFQNPKLAADDFIKFISS
jgi:pimeloyl-ACP methyl ester carboxylesterase